LAAVPGVTVLNDTFFNEFTVRLPKPAVDVVDTLAERGVLAGVPVSRMLPNAGLDDLLLVAATETTSDEDITALGTALEEVLS
jgi:glycine dehydrogenase subunit 1